MPANNSSAIMHYWMGAHPGKIGWLLGPSGWGKCRLQPWIDYALDNDAFAAWSSGTIWEEAPWLDMLERARRYKPTKPRWVLVPDSVGNKVETQKLWQKYAPIAAQYGWPLAFAVQDGMTPEDVPSDAEVVFVGGTTNWKWKNLTMWTDRFRRVHVGRVNELRRLLTCERLGVESVDGTGWFRDSQTGRRVMVLNAWLNKTLPEQPDLFA